MNPSWNINALITTIILIIGATILGSEHGWKTGLGIGLIAFAIMPFPPEEKTTRKNRSGG